MKKTAMAPRPPKKPKEDKTCSKGGCKTGKKC